MDGMIQKVIKGKRQAMAQLWEGAADRVYGMALLLTGNAEPAAAAAGAGLKAALQAAAKGKLETEGEFMPLALRHTASQCKKAVERADARAFKLPTKRDFRIGPVSQLPSGAAESAACLPPLQRFALVLRAAGQQNRSQIAKTMGVEVAAVDQISEAENENLSILGEAALSFETFSAKAPEELRKQMEQAVETIAAPLEAAAKAEARKKTLLAVIAAACAVVVLGAIGLVVALAPKKLDANLTYYADIEIADYGKITVKLDQEAAPRTAANFVELAESGFYDGLTFHRIIEGFMMQGGDPKADGTGNSGKTIRGEFKNNGFDNPLSHTRGAISMARGEEYNSASCQFFIVHEDSTASLDGKYACFGYVTEGIEVVDEICTTAQPTDGNGKISREQQPVITKITIRTEPKQ